jgi:hypothetical protein
VFLSFFTIFYCWRIAHARFTPSLPWYVLMATLILSTLYTIYDFYVNYELYKTVANLWPPFDRNLRILVNVVYKTGLLYFMIGIYKRLREKYKSEI